MGEFEKSMMGKKYFQKDLPELIKSNNRLAAALEKYTKVEEKKMLLEQKRRLNEKKDKTNE